MAKALGISIYPEHSTKEKDMAYISLAAQYGFTKIFTCLLSVEGDQQQIISNFKEIIQHAKDQKMDVMVDIAPRIFDKLNISYDDLSFFEQLGASGIRLDMGFRGQEESMMTYNKQDLTIEINMSNTTHYLETIMDHHPNREKLSGCHNFYPHRFSGLSRKFFLESSEKFKRYFIPTAAFVSSQDATFGPWPVTEGLCTLEEHRELPITTQVKHLFATNLIDTVYIANAYASEQELKEISEIMPNELSFKVELSEHISPLERTIVLEEPHFYRGDVSDFLIRSTQSRVKYKQEDFPAHDTKTIQRGDILIENNGYGQYKGELQIALREMPNSGNTNVVGRIQPNELFLLELLQPWQTFSFEL